jgi:hypothetical protein
MLYPTAIPSWPSSGRHAGAAPRLRSALTELEAVAGKDGLVVLEGLSGLLDVALVLRHQS